MLQKWYDTHHICSFGNTANHFFLPLLLLVIMVILLLVNEVSFIKEKQETRAHWNVKLKED